MIHLLILTNLNKEIIETKTNTVHGNLILYLLLKQQTRAVFYPRLF